MKLYTRRSAESFGFQSMVFDVSVVDCGRIVSNVHSHIMYATTTTVIHQRKMCN